jgi:PTS system fructose-specific IIA component/PTS system nitrogen regulatory IIA component
MIQQLIAAAAVLTEVKGKTKEAVLKELLQIGLDQGVIGKKTQTAIGKLLAEREVLGSTGIGNGVAVPHCKHDDVKQVFLVVARSKKGIEWQSIDGRLAQTFFFLLTPLSAADVHLRCLRWISGLARSADFRRFFLDAEDEPSIRDLLREMAPKD